MGALLLLMLMLLQSLRDFDCADSFLLEATGQGAPPRVGCAAPRWTFKAIEGPQHAPPSRQKSFWQQLESGSLLILKPVDEVCCVALGTVDDAAAVEFTSAVRRVASAILAQPGVDLLHRVIFVCLLPAVV